MGARKEQEIKHEIVVVQEVFKCMPHPVPIRGVRFGIFIRPEEYVFRVVVVALVGQFLSQAAEERSVVLQSGGPFRGVADRAF
jgi:hypothetical protein